MFRFHSRVGAVLVLAGLLPWAGCGGGGKSGGGLNTAFVPGDAAAVVVVHPQAFLKLPAAKKLPVDKIDSENKRFVGVSTDQIVELVAAFDDPTTGKEPEPALVVRFAPDVKGDTLFPMIRDKGKPTEVSGKKCYASNHPREPWLCQIDNSTFLFASEAMLKRMLDAKDNGKSIVHQRLKTANANAYLAGVFSVEAARPNLKKMAGEIPPIFLPGINTLPDRLSAVELSWSGANANLIELAFHAVDDAGAKDVETMANSLVTMAKGFLAQGMTGGALPKGPEGEKLKAQAEDALSKLKVVKNGPSVTVSLDHATLLDDIVAGVEKANTATRDSARSMLGTTKMRQVYMGMMNDMSIHNKFPTSIQSADGKPLLSWRVRILPYLEEQALYQQFHLNEPWDSEHNKKLIDKMPDIYKPAEGMARAGGTRIVAAAGPGLLFEDDQSYEKGKDGRSQTIALVQVGAESPVTWTQPDDLKLDLENPAAGLGKTHADGKIIVVLGDGRVLRLNQDVKPETLKALFTRDGGEPINWAELEK